MMISRSARVGLFAMALLAAPLLAVTSNKWHLEVSGTASADGVVIVQMLPVGAKPYEIKVPVANGTEENRVARLLEKALRNRLDSQIYLVDAGGNDVTIKRRSGHPDFQVAITRNSVPSVQIKLQTD